MTRFDGESKLSVEAFLTEFEEMSEMMRWNNLQKLIYCKRLLIRTAKEFLSSLTLSHVNTYDKLRVALVKEFGCVITSDVIHEQLRTCRKLSNETYKQYVYKMKEISKRGNIEDQALINYIVKGIGDDERNKMMLYGAENFDELRKRLEQYEKMKLQMLENRNPSHNSYKLRNVEVKGKPDMKTVNSGKCFNCNSSDHMKSACPHIQKGKRCFLCGEFGHELKSCPKKRTQEVVETEKRNVTSGKFSSNREVRFLSNNNYKRIEIVTPNFTKIVGCLIDTGSKISAMRKDVYESIGSPEITHNPEILTGFAATKIESLGAFELTSRIDNQSYNIICHVVSMSAMPMMMILGDNVLGEVILIVVRGVSHLIKSTGNCCQDFAAIKEFSSHMMNISQQKVASDELLSDACLDFTDINMLQCFMLNERNKPSDDVELRHIRNGADRFRLVNLIDNYKPEKTIKSKVEMTIILEDDKPVYCRPRKTSILEQKVIDDQVKEWLKDGILRPSVSNYSSPVLLVNKKDGNKRLCVDFRALNKKVVKDRYPLPLIEQQIDKLANVRWYSTLDLTNGFFHVSVSEESRKYLSIVTHDGQYEFQKAPFGFCNSPSVFQRYINEVFRNLIQEKKVITYLDDIVILGID